MLTMLGTKRRCKWKHTYCHCFHQTFLSTCTHLVSLQKVLSVSVDLSREYGAVEKAVKQVSI